MAIRIFVVLFVAVLISGCVREVVREVPVMAEPAQNGTSEPKELSAAEREALYNARKKAEEFYDYFDNHRDQDIRWLDDLVNKIKKQPDLSTWGYDVAGRDALFSAKQLLMDDDNTLARMRRWSDVYDYLLEVAPNVLREKTTSDQSHVKQELKTIESRYLAKLEDVKTKYKDMIDAASRGRTGQSFDRITELERQQRQLQRP